MQNIDDILFHGDGGPDHRARVQRMLAEDPEAREAFRRWSALLDAVGTEIDASLPDRRLLVLEGLRRFGGDAYLSADDAAELAATAGPLASALERHPGLQFVVDDVVRDAEAFDRTWNEVQSGRPRKPRTYAGDRRAYGRRSGLRWIWRVSAGVAVIAFVGVLFLLAQREAGLTTIATGANEVRELTLADGSSVLLLANSELAFRPVEDGAVFDRFARLNGSAFFEIAPDREGFTIDLPTAVVVVLGTSFGIQADEGEARVYLANGRLSVASQASRVAPVVLEAGEMTSVVRNEPPASPTATDMTQALAWTGLLVFQDTPLAEVATVLSDVYDLRITVDPLLEAETLTGRFDRSQDAATVLESIAAALDASVSVSGDTRTIRPR